MTCEASESELLTFLAAGALSEEERSRVIAHVIECPTCQADLATKRVLVDGLRDAHLTSDEIVEAVADGKRHAVHLAMCDRCRAEVADLRRLDAQLQRGADSLAVPLATRARLLAVPLVAIVTLALGLIWWWQREPKRQPEPPVASPLAVRFAPMPVEPSPGLVPPEPALRTLALAPVGPRADGELPAVSRGVEPGHLRLTLLLEKDFGSSRYRVEVEGRDGGRVWSRGAVEATTVDGVPAVAVELPLESLRRGDYRVRVTASEGGEETIGSYRFRLLP